MSRLTERIENFNRAFNIYQQAVQEFDWEKILSHMALIQSYEVTCELAWKVLKDYLFENGISVSLPKQVVKEAFNKNIIQDGQLWIDMIEARNATSHEYNLEKVSVLLTNISSNFYKELLKFYDLVNSKEF